MLTTYQARAGNVRALAGAVVFGCAVGLLIGGSYLEGAGARQALVKPAATHGQPASTAPTSGAIALSGPKGKQAAANDDMPLPLYPSAGVKAVTTLASAAPVNPAMALRDRFRLALTSVAQPFHYRQDTGHGADTNCLAQAVYYEARGESASGQAAVAQVVLNRVRHPAFPKTVCGVVYQRSSLGCQFSFACNGAMHNALEPGSWRRAQQVAQRALGGSVMPAVGEATQFQAARSGGWASGLLKVAQIGEHVFFRFAGHAGSAGMFHGQPELSSHAVGPAYATVATLGPAAAAKTQAAASPVAVQPQPAPVSAIGVQKTVDDATASKPSPGLTPVKADETPGPKGALSVASAGL